MPGKPAARLTDTTTHGSPLFPGPGSPNVLIGFLPAWRTLIDFHACPVVKGTVPDVGGVVMMGSPTVWINFQMQCRVMDQVIEIPGGPNPIAMGCPTVLIGEAGTMAPPAPGVAVPSPPGAPGPAAEKIAPPLINRSAEWQQASRAGRRRISEAIGEEGMEVEAKRRGYERPPILSPQDASERPQGFNGVYRDPKDGAIVVAEAKGGYNGKELDQILGTGYGHEQGSVGWTRAAAEATVNSRTANEAEKRAAQQVLDAIKTGRPPVRVEVFHTEHTGGVPGATKHYVTAITS